MASTNPERIPTSSHSQSRSKKTAILVAGLFSLLLIVFALVYLSRAGQANSDTGSSAAVAGDAPVMKIVVSETGIYRLTMDDLHKAGWTGDLESPEHIRLTRQGHDRSFFLDRSPGTPAILFYGQPVAGIFSSDTVYLLQDLAAAAKQEAVEDEPATPIEQPLAAPENLPAGSYYSVQHVEENQLYLPQADGDERWFWLPLTAPATQTVELDIQDVSKNGASRQDLARLAVKLYSSTEAPVSPNHQLNLMVNDRQVAEQSWDGKGTHQIDVWFDHNLLHEGVNRITLVAPGVEGVAADISHLDWIEVGYPRRLHALEDKLDFWSPGGDLSLSGFSGPVGIFEITDAGNIEQIGETVLESGNAILQSTPGHHYMAVGPEGYLKPGRISPLVDQPDLRQPEGGADYIAIGPENLLSELDPLLEHRREHGLTTAAIPVQAVYDQFNYGQSSPQAIQKFLRFAVENWDPAPRYLLLVGDASYDPKGYQSSPDANQLVVPLVDTVYGGQTTSDVPFVQINADDWPDLAVGLVPARTAEQVHIFVEKTLAYERSMAEGDGLVSVLAVADGFEPSFRWDAEAFLDLFAQDTPSDLIAPDPGDTDTSSQIEEKLEDGVSLLAYFGHGSLSMWGKDRLFTVEDAAGLNNAAQLPVVLNMTCLTGLYTHPEVDSLAETLLFNKNGGAAAVLAPSSLTLAVDQSFLSRPLIEEMLEDPQATLGDIHLSARRRISLDSPGMRDVMMTFMLFGDPALSLPSITSTP